MTCVEFPRQRQEHNNFWLPHPCRHHGGFAIFYDPSACRCHHSHETYPRGEDPHKIKSVSNQTTKEQSETMMKSLLPSQLLFILFAVVVVNGVHAFSTTAISSSSRSSSSTIERPKTVINTIEDDRLIELANKYVNEQNGFYAPIDEDAHSETFVFRGGVIGPLNKSDYCTTMTKLGISKAFDLDSNSFGYIVDPDMKNTVRFNVRYTGRQVQNWQIVGTPINIPPTSGLPNIVGPTEQFCIQFDDKEKVQYLTISAPMLTGSNTQPVTTGKFGAVLGLFVHCNYEIAAESALNGSVRKISNMVADLLPNDISPPKSATIVENLPSWYIQG